MRICSEDSIARVRGNADDLRPDLFQIIGDDSTVPVYRVVDVGSTRIRMEFDKNRYERLRAAVLGGYRAGALTRQKRHRHGKKKCAEHDERESRT